MRFTVTTALYVAPAVAGCCGRFASPSASPRAEPDVTTAAQWRPHLLLTVLSQPFQGRSCSGAQARVAQRRRPWPRTDTAAAAALAAQDGPRQRRWPLLAASREK